MLAILIILLGTYLRFNNLHLMEFKGDEAIALFMARDLAAFRNIPLTGLMSGAGIFNPPLFIYLLAIPSLISQEPLFVTSFIVILNIIAIYLCYLVGKRFHSETAGLISSALFSVSPWAVNFSRKIWAQDLLPIFTTALLYLLLHWIIKNEKSRQKSGSRLLSGKKILWILIVFTFILQLHYSALAFIPLLILIYLVFRPSIDIKHLVLGIAIAFLLYLPFIIYEIGHNFCDVLGIINSTSSFDLKQSWQSFVNIFRSALDNINFYNFSYMVGDTADRLYTPLNYLFAAVERYIFIIGLIYCCTRKRYIIYSLWFLIPVFTWGLAGISPKPHYTIILYPIQFLIIGIFLADMKRWIRLIVIPIITTQIIFNINLHESIKAYGTSWGDYGIGYSYKRDAIRYIVDTANGEVFSVSSTGIQDSPHPDFSYNSLNPEYWYLLYANVRRPASNIASNTYHFSISTSSSTPKNLTHLKYIKSTFFGPLWVHQFKVLSPQSPP